MEILINELSLSGQFISEDEFLKNLTKVLSLLAKVVNNPPFWNDTQKHLTGDTYQYNGILVNGSSLCESCERDKIVLSFKHDNYLHNILDIYKNTNLVKVINVIDRIKFLDFLYSKSFYLQKNIVYLDSKIQI
jgi:hypothetical protein